MTTVPYKQIVIAMGEGARAGLAAFDHLIRTPLVVESGSVGDDTRSAGAEVAERVAEPVMA